MTAVNIEILRISGSYQEQLHNLFFKHAQPATTLAVLLPGLRYTCQMPLLYYTSSLLVERGVDVLNLHSDYTSPGFQNLPPQERFDHMLADALNAFEKARSQGKYNRHILVGKSLGTLVMGLLLKAQSDLAQALTIWQTPLLNLPWVEQAATEFKGPALFIAGGADKSFSLEVLECVQAATGAESLIIPDATHSLEIPGELNRSLEALQKIIKHTAAFLDRHGISRN